jgi:hypothetical protein
MYKSLRQIFILLVNPLAVYFAVLPLLQILFGVSIFASSGGGAIAPIGIGALYLMSITSMITVALLLVFLILFKLTYIFLSDGK